MRILHVINSCDQKDGGAQILTLQLHLKINPNLVDSYLLALSGELDEDVRNAVSLRAKSPYHPIAFIKLLLLLSKNRRHFDIIHVHLFPAQLYVAIISKLIKISAILVTNEHSTNNKRRGNIGGKIIDKIVYKCYKSIFFVSNGAMKSFKEWMPKYEGILKTIKNGINLEPYANINRIKKGVNNVIRLITVARLTKAKNIQNTVRSLSLLRDYPFEYWIVGEGDCKEDIIQTIKECSLQDKVKLFGYRSDIPSLLKKADVFILFSRWEGFGLSVVEGMAAGLPVLISDIPGMSEIINTKQPAGLLADPTSIESMMVVLKQIVLSGNLREKLGKNAYLNAINYDVNNTVDEYAQIYQKLTSTRAINQPEYHSIMNIMACPKCKSKLYKEKESIYCAGKYCPYSQKPFILVDNLPVLVDFQSSILKKYLLEADKATSIVKRRRDDTFLVKLKKYLLGENKVSEKNEQKFINILKKKTEKPVCLIVGGGTIGSGMKFLYKNCDIENISFDIYPSKHITFIADAHQVPLGDNTVDGVWIQAVLEHVLDPHKVVSEIYRVLKPDGIVYAETAFMQQVHEKAYDFTRYTHSGHRWLFRDFAELSSGFIGGPGTQCLWTIEHLSRALFRSTKIGKVMKLIFSPLRHLDKICQTEVSLDAACGVFFMGYKNNTALVQSDMLAYYIKARENI